MIQPKGNDEASAIRKKVEAGRKVLLDFARNDYGTAIHKNI
jgi:hypothetical protein